MHAQLLRASATNATSATNFAFNSSRAAFLVSCCARGVLCMRAANTLRATPGAHAAR
jgi:hypothetical protein